MLVQRNDVINPVLGHSERQQENRFQNLPFLTAPNEARKQRRIITAVPLGIKENR